MNNVEFIPKNIVYPDNEKKKLNELEVLFQEWYKNILDKDPNNAKRVVFDGFYPYYFSQKIRILYIGRESLGLKGENYISSLFKAYKNKKIGDTGINKYKFHCRMFYITYGIISSIDNWEKGQKYFEWKDIPYASQLIETFATEEGFSFAFINISKFSNESGHYKADWESINRSLELSISGNDNFVKKEIEILDPQIIVSMNLGKEILKSLGWTLINESENVNTYQKENSNDDRVILLDAFHFSANKSGEYNFYIPIISIVEEILSKIIK